MTQVRDNDTVADEVDRLYELPLEEFTAARNELAKRLGDASVKQLKKPTVPAWTVNQLARSREVDIRRLLRAGEQLEQAQKKAVEGGDQKAFERARDAERDALRRLRSQAADLLKAGGHPANDSTLERVASTLRAGSATEEGRALLREGRLSEELEPQGFGALAGVKPAAPRDAEEEGPGHEPRAQGPRRRRHGDRRSRGRRRARTRRGARGSTSCAVPPSARQRRPSACARRPTSSRARTPLRRKRKARQKVRARPLL